MLLRAKNAECVFVFSMMSHVLQEANKAECVFVFSVMSNVLQRANKAEHGLVSGMLTRTSMKLLYWFASHCVFSAMWKACCNMQTTQSPGIRRVHKEHGQNYRTLCIVSDVDTGRQHRVWPGIERVHKEHQQSYHMLCIVSDVNTDNTVWPGIEHVHKEH